MRLPLAAAALVVASAGCGAPPAPSATPAPPRRPNVVLVLLDAVRADRLGVYGAAQETMPFVAGLAARGLVFERAYAPSSWTPSSMASIFTGTWVHQHGVRSGFVATRNALKRGDTVVLNRIPEGLETLPAVLKQAGYATYGAADNFNVSPVMGFARGFDEYRAKDAGGLRRGKTVTEWRAWLLAAQPFFLYLHDMSAHAPYRKRAPWYDPATPKQRHDVAAYDSSLSYMDEAIRELFSSLGLERDAIVIVTADHGEEFGDHGGFQHGHTLYEELLRVPLVVFAPGRVAPARVARPVSTIDILPTLRQLLALPASPQDQGRSLLAAAPPGAERERVLFPMRWNELGPAPSVKKAVVTERYKLILTEPGGAEELYDLQQDARETRNLARERRPLVAALRGRLAELEARTRPAEREFAAGVEVSKEKAEELRALGYVQ